MTPRKKTFAMCRLQIRTKKKGTYLKISKHRSTLPKSHRLEPAYQNIHHNQKLRWLGTAACVPLHPTPLTTFSRFIRHFIHITGQTSEHFLWFSITFFSQVYIFFLSSFFTFPNMAGRKRGRPESLSSRRLFFIFTLIFIYCPDTQNSSRISIN